MIKVSDKAKEHIIKLMEEQNTPSTEFNLRVGVKGGGCSGFSYFMEFDNETSEKDEIIKIDETLTVVMEKKFLVYLFGTELTYSDGLNGKGFEWINPQATRVCGCGESFAI